ncbi:MAG: RHS repeat-associated core domain-containing protein [Pirellulaceae bacterium]|nr:RHS repeat-associated core domain-containing protein [Pirellulaceae bacterium]
MRQFEWDYRNRLVAVTDRDSAGGAATMTAKYTYDAFNRRIAKAVDTNPQDSGDAAITHFVYDGENVRLELLDVDGSGPQPASFHSRLLYGPAVDQILTQEDSAGVVFWHLADHLGTVHDLVNSAGVVANHIVYDSFGNILSPTNAASASRYLFTGREFDAETGQYDNRARYYDSATGRFISADSLAAANKYAYVKNNPVQFTDPSGKASAGERVREFINEFGRLVKQFLDFLGNVIREVVEFVGKVVNGDFVVKPNNGKKVIPIKKPQIRIAPIPTAEPESSGCPSNRFISEDTSGAISDSSGKIITKGVGNILTKGVGNILAKGLTKSGAGIDA